MRICGAKLQNVGPRFFYNFLKLVKTENGQSLFRLPRLFGHRRFFYRRFSIVNAEARLFTAIARRFTEEKR